MTIKARTMYRMVEDIGGGPAGESRKLLFLSGKQAELIASSNAIQNGGNETIGYGERFGTNDDAYYYVEVRTFGEPSCYTPYTLEIVGLR